MRLLSPATQMLTILIVALSINIILVGAISSMNFKQLVTVITRPRRKTCLDHIYANFPTRIHSVNAYNTGHSVHLPVFGVRLYGTKEFSRLIGR